MANEGLMRELKTSWKDLTPVNFTKIGREVNPHAYYIRRRK